MTETNPLRIHLATRRKALGTARSSTATSSSTNIAKAGSAAMFGARAARSSTTSGQPLPHDGELPSASCISPRVPGSAPSTTRIRHAGQVIHDGWLVQYRRRRQDRPARLVPAHHRSLEGPVIKSGGEWISSVDLENAAIVALKGVVRSCGGGAASSRAKWDERPVALVVRCRRQRGQPTREDIHRASSRCGLRKVAASGRRRLRRRITPYGDRQGPEDGPARAVQGPYPALGRR